MIIVGVDPGSTTGWAFCNPDPEKDIFVAGERPAMDAPLMFEHSLHQYPQVLIACERFTISMNTLKKTRAGSQDALDVIGAVRYLAAKYGWKFERQDASAVKQLATDKRLRDLGMWTPGHGHANDAARHVLFARVKGGWYSSVLNDG